MKSYYEKERHPWGTKVFPFIKYSVKHLKPGKVLSLGGGDGVDSIYLAKKGFEVTNVDIDPQAIKIFNEDAKKESLTVKSEVSDIAGYNFKEKYDNIITLFTLQFLKRKEALDLIKKIKLNTKSEGINIIINFTKKGEFDKVNSLQNFYLEEDELKKLYSNWQIVKHVKMIGKTKSGLKQEREMIVAKKP